MRTNWRGRLENHLASFARQFQFNTESTKVVSQITRLKLYFKNGVGKLKLWERLQRPWLDLSYCSFSTATVTWTSFYVCPPLKIFAICLNFIHCFGVVDFCFFFLFLLFLSIFDFYFFPFFSAAIVLRWWFSSCVEESWGRELQWQKFGNGYSLASSVWNASVHSRYGNRVTRYCDSWKLKVAIVLSFYGKYSRHKLYQERMKSKAVNLP